MKILFVTLDEYPVFGTTSNIIKKLIFDGDLLHKVDEIGVITASKVRPKNEVEIIDGVKVFKIFTWRAISKKDLEKMMSQGLYIDFLDTFIAKCINKCRDFFRGSEFLRYDNIKIFSDAIQTYGQDYDIIIPIFGNYDAAAAAISVKRDNQKLVLYQVDPCSTNWVRSKKELTFIRNFEKDLYSKADLIITMPIYYDEVKKVAKLEDVDKFVLMELPLVFSNKKFYGGIKKNQKSIKCLFSGLIYSGIREPHYALKLFKNLGDNVEFHFVGVEQSELPTELISDKVICHGLVSSDEAEQYLMDADVLVNIGNKMTNQIPSKLFEYISTGKPIINICKNRDCPTLPYLLKYPLSLNLYEEEALLENQSKELKFFLEDNNCKRISESDITKKYVECTPRYCVDKMLEFLK